MIFLTESWSQNDSLFISMEMYHSVDHHFEYSRAAYIRLRMNISAYNGVVLKVVGLKLANRSSVKVWGILVKNSPFCLNMSASGNSNCLLS